MGQSAKIKETAQVSYKDVRLLSFLVFLFVLLLFFFPHVCFKLNSSKAERLNVFFIDFAAITTEVTITFPSVCLMNYINERRAHLCYSHC